MEYKVFLILVKAQDNNQLANNGRSFGFARYTPTTAPDSTTPRAWCSCNWQIQK